MPAWITSLLRALVAVPKCSAASSISDVATTQGQLACHRKSDDPGPDDDGVDVFHVTAV